MERNLDRRVETMTPIRDRALLTHIQQVVLDAYLRDSAAAMSLDSTGRYHRLTTGSPDDFSAQQALLKYYAEARDQ
jgi:polyphosphate kinase